MILLETKIELKCLPGSQNTQPNTPIVGKHLELPPWVEKTWLTILLGALVPPCLEKNLSFPLIDMKLSVWKHGKRFRLFITEYDSSKPQKPEQILKTFIPFPVSERRNFAVWSFYLLMTLLIILPSLFAVMWPHKNRVHPLRPNCEPALSSYTQCIDCCVSPLSGRGRAGSVCVKETHPQRVFMCLEEFYLALLLLL